MQSIKSGNNKSKQGIKSLLLMGTPVKSKLKLNKQLSKELIIACNFQWWFFHFKRTCTSLQEHVKNFTYNFNTNLILTGKSLQFLQEVGVIKRMRKPTKPWGLVSYNGNWLQFYWDLISTWVDLLLNTVWKEKYPPEKKNVGSWCLSELMPPWNIMKFD